MIALSSVAFAPLLPLPVLACLAAAGALPLLLAAVRHAPGAAWRALALALALLWLSGPRRVVRTGIPLPDIALLVVDHSASMLVGHRAAIAETAARRLQGQVRPGTPALQLRRVDVPEAGTSGTLLFAAIDAALADIPPDQRAGVIALTDGAVADAPRRFDLPLHTLIPAAGEQTDRRLRILRAPGYGIVGQSVQIGLVVDDLGGAGGGTAQVSWSQDGAPAGTQDVTIGAAATITVPITRAGPSTVSLTVAALPGEASLLNNRAALSINGVRDRLRVLLISGEPHAGERTWRRLLKADPAVDLVHFTILRTPGKDDLTPLNQLALIAFPVRELFVEKIRQFDLVILDRFSDPGILPGIYLQNIADYVRQGGALLVDAGPEFAGAGSIANGPIGEILPAAPRDGEDAVVTGPFRPVVTALGERHPVTENLAGDVPGGVPRWGEWYRRIAPAAAHGDVVLQAGADAAPLLLLDHVGSGRVALLLSDQIWLWSRGHQGGGPQAELLRRVAHWLMKEPELDENALDATIAQGMLLIERHATTKADPSTMLEITDPDGQRSSARLTLAHGHETASVPATSPGLWQVTFGDRHATAAAIPEDAAEYADLRATATRLGPISRTVHWLEPDGAPSLARLDLRQNRALRLTGITSATILPAWAVLPLLLACLLLGWRREGR